jgi:hypothetical protein
MGSDIFNMVRTSIIHRLISLGAVYILDATDRGSPLGERFARRPKLKRPIHYHSGKGAPSAADRGLCLYYLS